MKRILGLMGLFFFVQQASAESYLSCSNGSFDELGDQYYEINFLERTVEFLPYEGSFEVEMKHDVGVMSITNTQVTTWAEGEEEDSVINAMLLLSSDKTKLNVAISQDEGPFQSYEMTCVQK